MTLPALFVEFAFPLGTQMHVIRNDGAVFTLGRVDGLSAMPMEWQELPPVPGSTRAEIVSQSYKQFLERERA